MTHKFEVVYIQEEISLENSEFGQIDLTEEAKNILYNTDAEFIEVSNEPLENCLYLHFQKEIGFNHKFAIYRFGEQEADFCLTRLYEIFGEVPKIIYLKINP